LQELIEKPDNGFDMRVDEMEAKIRSLDHKLSKLNHDESVAIVCFSGDWDRLFAAFTIANGALALGKEVHMYFTFWGASAIRKKPRRKTIKRTPTQKFLGWMLPDSINDVPLSKGNFGGLGKRMLGKLMAQKGVDDLPALVNQARELGAHFHCCDTSLQLFGWGCDNLIEGEQSNWCGVTAFLSLAFKSKVTLFI